MSAAVAAIEFALTTDDGLGFLRNWNEGEFDKIRLYWPEAPEAIYIGADPLHPETRRAGNQDAERLAKLLEFCTEAKPQFGPKGELRAMTMKFKNSVETSTGYRKELRKLIDDMQPTPKGCAR